VSVLALPTAWIHRRTINSQKYDVGTSARPIQARLRTNKHPSDVGRLPMRSARVPQNMGALGGNDKPGNKQHAPSFTDIHLETPDKPSP
jgi:hypothetical protein